MIKKKTTAETVIKAKNSQLKSLVNFNNYNKYNFGDFSSIIILPTRDFYKKVGEIMVVYKDPKPTKNGRTWYFKFNMHLVLLSSIDLKDI